PPVQVQISCWVPLAVPEPGSSRHLPDPVPTSEEADPAVHSWLVPPLQVHSSTSTPLAVPLPVTSRHLPASCTVPSPTVQVCAALPGAQVAMTTGVPLAVPFAARHLPASPEAIAPVRVGTPVTTRLSNWSVW